MHSTTQLRTGTHGNLASVATNALCICRSLSTHDKMFFEAKPVARLAEARPFLANADVIGIDEGQFFPDVRALFASCLMLNAPWH